MNKALRTKANMIKKLTFFALQYSLISLKKLLDSVNKIVYKLQVAMNRLLSSVKFV